MAFAAAMLPAMASGEVRTVTAFPSDRSTALRRSATKSSARGQCPSQLTKSRRAGNTWESAACTFTHNQNLKGIRTARRASPGSYDMTGVDQGALPAPPPAIGEWRRRRSNQGERRLAHSSPTKRLGVLALVVLSLGSVVQLAAGVASDADPCAPESTLVACENSRPGNPRSEWDITGSGSVSIQGFATDISVNHGEPVFFKINTPASAFRLDIYRSGILRGDRARKLATVAPSASLPQAQPACASDPATGLVDCGTWSVSASWTFRSDAVSGVLARQTDRTDGVSGESHIVFVVRDDDRQADLLVQTSDTTWQRTTRTAGQSLQRWTLLPRYKVDYSRPFTLARAVRELAVPRRGSVLRWLEANGYDVTTHYRRRHDRRPPTARTQGLSVRPGMTSSGPPAARQRRAALAPA